jgi:hypothetical protein
MPPPLEPVTELPLKVELVTISVPVLELRMPPPSLPW